MKKSLPKIGIVMLASLISVSAWSQCPTVSCPADIIISSDTLNCGTTVTYTPPTGFDLCDATIETFNYSGVIDTWVVPAGVTFINIDARGAEGSNNTSSTMPPGLGATMVGNFIVTPGETLSIIVGQQYHDTGGNGGGGGSFVVDALNNPLIVAGGGGGSSQTLESVEKHGQVGTSGGAGAGGGGLGGTAGSGGTIGAAFASGAGGGLLTDGADGWTANSGGDAFVNGGAGANIGYGIGGFGGGGNGSGNVVGGGGGGYSGGGAGSNSLGGGTGGGGGSFNGGTSQINTGGANAGHGMVIITYGGATTTTFESGIGSGGNFPVGTTVETYSVVNSLGDSAWCSFNVTVYDSIAPTIASPADAISCETTVVGLTPTYSDNCTGETITYDMTGATVGSGSGDVSGMTFNEGTTTVWYFVTDASGNQDSSSFNVIVNPIPTVTMDAFNNNTMCVYHAPVPLPIGNPALGSYTGPGVVGATFDPATAGVGTHWIVYTYTNAEECSASDSTQITVDGCAGIQENPGLIGFNVYPNPSTGLYTVEFENATMDHFEIEITDAEGRLVYTNATEAELVKEVIDIREEARGVYLMKISSDKDSGIYRLVKN